MSTPDAIPPSYRCTELCLWCCVRDRGDSLASDPGGAPYTESHAAPDGIYEQAEAEFNEEWNAINGEGASEHVPTASSFASQVVQSQHI